MTQTQWNHYVDHDRETGELTFESQPDSENGVPFSVYHRRVGRYGLPQGVDYSGVEDEVIAWFREEAGSLLNEIVTLGETGWDGNNMVWGARTETGADRLVEIEREIDEIAGSCTLGRVEWDASDYYLSGLPTAQIVNELGITPEHTVDEIEKLIETDSAGASDGEGRAIALTDVAGLAQWIWDFVHEDDDED